MFFFNVLGSYLSFFYLNHISWIFLYDKRLLCFFLSKLESFRKIQINIILFYFWNYYFNKNLTSATFFKKVPTKSSAYLNMFVLIGRVVQLSDQQRHPARRAQASPIQVVAARLHASDNIHNIFFYVTDVFNFLDN